MHFGITRSATPVVVIQVEGPAQVRRNADTRQIGADHEVAGHLTLDPNIGLLREHPEN